MPSDTEAGHFILLSSLKHKGLRFPKSPALPDIPWADLAAPVLLELQWHGPGKEGKQLSCVSRDAQMPRALASPGPMNWAIMEALEEGCSPVSEPRGTAALGSKAAH